MTNTHTPTHTGINSDTPTDTDTTIDSGIYLVCVDLLDVAELAEICGYVGDWLGGAPPAVTASLARFGGPDAATILLEALARLADSLVRAVPSPSPTPAQSVTELTPGETLGLAQLLTDLARRGWPADTDEADCLAGDCRRWAMRLYSTPGMIA